MSFRRLTFAAVLLIVATACGSYKSPTAPAATTVNAAIGSSGFSPNPINIAVGSSVMWTNNDSSMHGVVADNGAFRSGALAMGAQYSYTFSTAGTFTYHDLSNAGMVGTVNVSSSY